jgi:hypothetical protein
MRHILLTLALCATTTLALAGEQTGTVTMEHGQHYSGPASAGFTFFILQGGAKSGRPPCNTHIDRWVINNNWPAARIQVAVLLSAIASGKTVTVRGSGDCSQWSDSETAIDIRLNN